MTDHMEELPDKNFMSRDVEGYIQSLNRINKKTLKSIWTP